jgi:hypothetical protein
MAFDVYPQPQTVPLTVAKGATSPAQTFVERASSNSPPADMYIRIAIDSGAVAPAPSLSASGGTAVLVPLSNNASTVSIFDHSGNYIAAASMVPDPSGFEGVYLLHVILTTLGSIWSISVQNTDTVDHIFTWVVADNIGDSQQPWIDMATIMPFEILIADAATQTLSISNHGTGPLTSIGSALSGAQAASFAVTVPANTSVNPNKSSVGVTVALNAVATPSALTAVLDFTSNDTTARKASGHNSEVQLGARVGMLELGFMLDASGSMGLDGPGTGTSPSRWSLLVSAASAALDALTNFASGKGNFAVGVYPDILTPSLGVPSANTFQGVMPINAANIQTAKTAIQNNKNVPEGSTPMGFGIGQAIGPLSAPPWNYFSDNAATNALNYRWLILMTDGNSNFDPPDPSDFYQNGGNGTAGQGFVPKDIQVIAIGYGLDGAPVQPVNKALLTTIVQGGLNPAAQNYDYAQADNGPGIVASFVKKTLDDVLTQDSFSDPAGVLTASNPTVTSQAIIGPYDNKISFIVAWSTANAERLDITVTTPLGEVIPPVPGAGCTSNIGDRYRMITFDKTFLDNATAGKPRYGVWTLTIRLPTIILESRAAAEAEDSEVYNYQIVTASRLNLRCRLDKVPYTAGDPVTLSARLSLDSQGITGAAVTVTQTTPGAAVVNWLASTPVSAADYAEAAGAQAKNPDIDSLGIKHFALQQKGITFAPVVRTATGNLTDADGTGTYTVTSSNTSVPGTYGFLVRAVGTLPDGSLFRREQSVTIEVIVRADPASTITQIEYLPGTGGNLQATVTVWPQDRFGNAILIDPKFDPSILFSTSTGGLTGAIADNHDGSYSQLVTYPAATPPIIGVTVGGVPVVPGIPLEPVADLHFVDKVYSFKAGAAATPGANQHADPTACLGDFTKKATPGFVSLGAGGSLIVGFSGHYARDDEHGHGITVFVHPDQPLRRYNVEGHYGDDDDGWFEIGQSPGVTQSFSLRRHGRPPTARAIRIRDLSGQVRNPDGTPSASPGVSILAVGARRIERGDGDLDDLVLAWLRKLGHEIFAG